MMIDSKLLIKKLNNPEVIDWIKEDQSPFWYHQGFLSGLLKAISIIHDCEYVQEHGHERIPFDLGEMSPETVEALKTIMSKIKNEIDERHDAYAQGIKDLSTLLTLIPCANCGFKGTEDCENEKENLTGCLTSDFNYFKTWADYNMFIKKKCNELTCKDITKATESIEKHC